MHRITIIIVNWNTVYLLKQCLDSVVSCSDDSCRIMVVDNASDDASVSVVTTFFPQVELITNSENLGFAGGNNIALGSTDTEYVVLLNSDTILSPDCVALMLEFMDTRPGVVACAPALRLPSGKLQTGGGGFELTLITAFNYFLCLSKLFPFLCKGFYIDQATYVKLRQPVKVGWLAGTCLMVRKSAIDDVGGLDDGYFMYAEDAEWCDRLRTRGDIYYLPGLEIVHYQGASSKSRGAVSTEWLEATCNYFLAKHGVVKTSVFRVILVAGFLLRFAAYFFMSFFDDGYRGNADAMRAFLVFSARWEMKS